MLKAIRQSLRECPGAADSGIHQKNATPADARSEIDFLIETIRPSVLLSDRDSRFIETKGKREIFALDKSSMLVAKTDVDLVDQWRSEYMALAFPFSIPRVVGGADYPRKKRFRRHADAACSLPGSLLECTLGE